MSDSPRGQIPSYLGAMAAYGGAMVAAAVAGRLAAKELDRGSSTSDVVLGAVATHKFARLAAKQGSHPQHTIGELLVCPFCLAPWVAGGYGRIRTE